MKLSAEDFIKYNLNWEASGLQPLEKLGGLSSENYKVIYNDKDYFLRVCPYTYIHTNRTLEFEIINKAADIGLCEKPYYYEPKTGDMVSPWIYGNMPSEEEFASFKFIDMVTENLKKLHTLTCDAEFQLYNHIKTRIDLCKEYEIPLPASIDAILITLNKLEMKLSKNKILGLCHNDLNASNMILHKDKLYFVDYEYASMGDIFFDLATASWFMNCRCRKYLITSYFGEYKTEYYEKLLDYLYIVKLYNATWSLLKSKDSTGEYDYLKGANMIFEDLLNFESIRT